MHERESDGEIAYKMLCVYVTCMYVCMRHSCYSNAYTHAYVYIYIYMYILDITCKREEDTKRERERERDELRMPAVFGVSIPVHRHLSVQYGYTG